MIATNLALFPRERLETLSAASAAPILPGDHQPDASQHREVAHRTESGKSFGQGLGQSMKALGREAGRTQVKQPEQIRSRKQS